MRYRATQNKFFQRRAPTKRSRPLRIKLNVGQLLKNYSWMLLLAVLAVVNVCIISFSDKPWQQYQLKAQKKGAGLRAKLTPQPLGFWNERHSSFSHAVSVAAPQQTAQAGLTTTQPGLQRPVIDALKGDAASEPQVELHKTNIRSGQTFMKVLLTLELSVQQANAITMALKEHFDFRRIRPGDEIIVTRTDSHITRVELKRGVAELYAAWPSDGSWKAEQVQLKREKRTKEVSGTITSSIYGALVEMKQSPGLAAEFADIFSWEIDFFSEVHTGDRFSLVIEEEYIDGEKLQRTPRILAAAYKGQVGTYQAYRSDDGRYYDEQGHSVQKAFLRALLQYARVTSSYGRRIHPVLRYSKMHNGVDYRSPVGTPVWSVADGTVMKARYDRVSGYYVVIRHPMGYTSIYAHLSKLMVKAGQRVKQKQVIAKTGNTGRSTGPHLHYGMTKHKRFVDPATQRFPSGTPLKDSEMPAFTKAVQQLRPRLHLSAKSTKNSIYLAGIE